MVQRLALAFPNNDSSGQSRTDLNRLGPLNLFSSIFISLDNSAGSFMNDVDEDDRRCTAAFEGIKGAEPVVITDSHIPTVPF
jgi:hypothetical protein